MAVLVADASGHGLAAALVIAQVRAMLRALCEVQTDPSRLLEWVNRRLAHDLVEGRFVTAFFACLSAGGLLRWASAGQGPILVRRSAHGPFEPLHAQAVPLGVADHLMTDPAPSMSLGPGGMLAAMTDGVFEARGPEGQMLGADRVARILDEHGSLGLSDLLVRLQTAVGAWQGSDQPADDQTIVLVRRAG
jgi:serine phosphatase RsbU (regulator of sigma subunit)